MYDDARRTILNTDNELPFPTRDYQLDKDGFYVTEYHDLKVASVGTLQHHCKNFKLTYSGLCKKELVEKLTAFSLLGQTGWKEHISPEPKKKTKVATRHDALFGGDRTSNKSALPTRSKDNHSIEQIEAPIIWAQMAVARYHSKTAFTETFQHSLFIPTGVCGSVPSSGETSIGKPDNMSPGLVDMLHDEIQQSVTSSGCLFSPPAHIATMDINDQPEVTVNLTASSDSTPLPDVPVHLDAANPPTVCQTVHVLQLGGGRGELYFTDADVPVAPLYWSAKNIDHFAKMWDDDSCCWAPGHDALHIKGIPIPVKLFPAVYRGGSGTVKAQWARIKNQWSLWCICTSIIPYTLFLMVYQDTNVDIPMSFMVIGNHLHKKRAAENERLVKQAYCEYGNNFNTMFCYKTAGGHVKPMIHPWVIVKTYRKLNGITDIFDADKSDGDN
ncbi:hypothetical protein EDD18DRAFT_1352840 [Armillaria luteobubalina]|uniref:Uncharacterized protein n=1 Tax=Armillaria luteobubalina TaxID=153913 RepID=A0AA39Q8P4_9AGAR|nr:hypothetical protein EDD18DRAFT_1352840 [Armillaria luteobubalina]